MRILFLGDVVGISGCSKLTSNLLNEIYKNKIDFVIVNGENAAAQGVGLTKEIFKIGLGFSYQEVKKIPINKYDKKLDLIITEKKIIQ